MASRVVVEGTDRQCHGLAPEKTSQLIVAQVGGTTAAAMGKRTDGRLRGARHRPFITPVASRPTILQTRQPRGASPGGGVLPPLRHPRTQPPSSTTTTTREPRRRGARRRPFITPVASRPITLQTRQPRGVRPGGGVLPPLRHPRTQLPSSTSRTTREPRRRGPSTPRGSVDFSRIEPSRRRRTSSCDSSRNNPISRSASRHDDARYRRDSGRKP